MDDIYWYFILLLVIVLILPEDKRFIVILLASGLSLLLLMGITLDYHYPLPKTIEEVPAGPVEEIPAGPVEEKVSANSEYIEQLMNQPYNEDMINDYYKKPAYEEMFADYGLAKAQKRLLHHNDVMRENESKFQYNKFAPFFGDEVEISYEKAWYGPDY